MRFSADNNVTDIGVVRQLVADNPWATIVSHSPTGSLVASHYPILLDETDELAVVTHVGRPDDLVHGFSDREILLIVAGQHGYISPSWYAPGAMPAPTWNFSVAHCYGVPQVLDSETNIAVLTRLVKHFEDHVASPMQLTREAADRLAPGTVGLRIPITRFVCKVKMSQDKDIETRRNVIAQLRGDGPYNNPALADAMESLLPS